MRYLNAKHIKAAATFEGMLAAILKAMLQLETGDYLLPDRMHLDQGGNTLLLMPCMTAESFGTKLVSVFPKNASIQEPPIYGLMVLNDGKTGKPLAILDGGQLTAFRTGAVGGVSIEYLTPPNLSKVGIIGAGTQGAYQALFACAVRPVSEIFVYNRSPKPIEKFQAIINEYFPSVKITIQPAAAAVLENSQLIITATTSSTPVLPDDPKLFMGKHFLGVGSFRPDMREFPDSFFPILGDIYVDILLAKRESGDLAQPLKNGWIKEQQVKTLGNRIKNGYIAAESTTTPSFFKSVGMALFDLYAAQYIYGVATKNKLGIELN